MNELQRRAVLLALVQELHARQSWCGETHIQKSVYFGQELRGLETGFDFILHKHGPFSFDLRDELSSMQAEGLLTLKIQQPPYGATITLASLADRLLQRFPKTVGRNLDTLRFVAQEFGGRRVGELERLATALYVTREFDLNNEDARARRLTYLKPHIDLDDARIAVRRIDNLLARGEDPDE
jgi:hypothetical protein